MATPLRTKLVSANAERVDFDHTLSAQLNSVTQANADAIGAPFEFIAYPLFTVAASFLGMPTSA